MKLQTKTSGIVVFVICVFMLLVLTAQSRVVIPKFEKINIQKAFDDSDEGLRSVEEALDAMMTTATDYALWDDTYLFAHDKNSNYVNANFAPSALSNLDVTYVGIVSEDDVFYSLNAFENEQETARINQALLDLDFSQSDEKSGFLTAGDKTYMFAARQIRTTDLTTSSNYYFTFMREYKDYLIEDLSSLPSLSLSLLDLSTMETEEKSKVEKLFATQDYATQNYEIRDYGSREATSQGFTASDYHFSNKTVYEMTDDYVGAYTYLFNTNGQPFAILKSETDNSIILESQKLVFHSYLFVLGLGLMLTLVISLFVNRSIIKPVNRLKSGMHALLLNNDDAFILSKSKMISRKDEIGDLTNSFLSVSQEIKEAREKSERINERLEDRLERMAFYDVLTGLANRALFYDHLQQAISRARRYHYKLAVIYIDLDGFKMVNETFGHHNGDFLLTEIAKRIRNYIRETDLVSRLGGDEFSIILEGIKDQEDLVKIANSLLIDISRDIVIAGETISISGSMGIAVFPQDGDDIEEILKKADAAVHASKDTGKNCYTFASNNDEMRMIPKIILINRIKKAIERTEFNLVYQPQLMAAVAPISRSEKLDYHLKISGAEALIRWKNDQGVIYMPDEFIELAEESGLIIPVGEWVIEEACASIRELELLGRAVPVSVNVSIKQFKSKRLVDVIKSCIENANIDAKNLFIEITESIFAEDESKVVESIRELKELGITIVLDDFGKGYSSLAIVSKLPFDFIKIDKAFIQNSALEEENNLATTILTMAEKLNMPAICEGVETREQLEYLLKNGARIFQGFYFSKPLEKEAVIDLCQHKGWPDKK